MLIEDNKVLFEELLAQRLERKEFTRFGPSTSLQFCRATGESQQLLDFDSRSENHKLLYGCNVGLRFPEVEAILGRSEGTPLTPTVAVPIHLLGDDDSFFEWVLREGSSCEDLVDEVMEDIELLAFPFLDRFSSIVKVEESLSSSKPTDWFVLTAEQRIAVLAAILKLRGRLDRALDLIDFALLEREEAPAKKKRRLERLKDRMLLDG